MVVYIWQCYSLSSSFPLLPPPYLQVCSFYLHSISALKIGSSVSFFYIPYRGINIWYLFFSFWLTFLRDYSGNMHDRWTHWMRVCRRVSCRQNGVSMIKMKNNEGPKQGSGSGKRKGRQSYKMSILKILSCLILRRYQKAVKGKEGYHLLQLQLANILQCIWWF